MIVVETSAIIAILLGEPERGRLMSRLFQEREKVTPVTSLLEATMVGSRAFPDPRGPLEDLLRQTAISLVPIDEAHAAAAQQAFLTYGKGRHRARLNFGDCFSYAVAKLADAPLLFVGTDFSETDIRSALR